MKMLITHNEDFITAININQIVQISYMRLQKEHVSYIQIPKELDSENPIYLLDIVLNNGKQYNKLYNSHDECQKMFNDLVDFMKSNKEDDSTFDLYL